MRSRYSAYALAITSYIIKTTHRENIRFSKDLEEWKREILAFSFYYFKKLEILEFIPGEREASVTFKAYIYKNGQNFCFLEKSLFEKFENRWLYKKALRIEKF